MTKIKMIHSVRSIEHDLVGGLEYDIPEEIADEYILKGYCEGELSREYADHEVAGLKTLDQVVGT